jgi:Cof subfamily protein (haloacid dehalogenase superfamily)
MRSKDTETHLLVPASAKPEPAGTPHPIRLIATDLDGTLLRNDETISERNRQALVRAQGLGLTVVLATGRSPRNLIGIAREAGLDGLAICCNGAMIYDLDQEAIIQHKTLESAVARELIVQLREAMPGVCFCVELGTRIGMEPAYLALRQRPPREPPLVDDALALCSGPVTKIIVRHPYLSLEEVLGMTRAGASEAVSVTYSGFAFVEVAAAGVDKGWALEALCEHLNIRAAEVIAFGDMPNDLGMLAWAGHSVAMFNAHPEVLKQAREITVSNMDDGVALVLERLLANAAL